MSEQSPWGSPPPKNPYGQQPHQPPQPPQPPPSHPQQPHHPTPTTPYSQPGTGGGGYGGGYGGGPPYGGSPYGQGPQPPRRRTGLIIGIMLAVLLVAAAFTVTLVVASGDDDGDPDEAASSETATDSSEPSEPTESSDPSEPTTPTPETTDSAPQPGPGTIQGDGYTFELPNDAWTDASDEAGQVGGPTIDTVVVLGASIELAQSNVIVEALSDGGASSLEDLEGLWKRNLSGTDNATPVPIDEITIGGERAIGVRIDDRVNAAGVPIIQIAYLALHDDMQYSIGLSFGAQGDAVSEDDFESILDSWTWG